jgi:hypothetical protein
MEKHFCEKCNKEFQNSDALGQHRQAKHTPQPEVVKPKKSFPKKLVIAIIVLILVAVGGYFSFGIGNDEPKPVFDPSSLSDVGFDEEAFADKIPKGSIHRHPEVTITIKGQQQTIPPNIGLGRVHQPVHTHDEENILHWEVDRPTVENMQLGFFFNEVWKKTFNKECIFEFCNGPEGNLTMTVNGIDNAEFHRYMPEDGDDIRINYG